MLYKPLDYSISKISLPADYSQDDSISKISLPTDVSRDFSGLIKRWENVQIIVVLDRKK